MNYLNYELLDIEVKVKAASEICYKTHTTLPIKTMTTAK